MVVFAVLIEAESLRVQHMVAAVPVAVAVNVPVPVAAATTAALRVSQATQAAAKAGAVMTAAQH